MILGPLAVLPARWLLEIKMRMMQSAGAWRLSATLFGSQVRVSYLGDNGSVTRKKLGQHQVRAPPVHSMSLCHTPHVALLGLSQGRDGMHFTDHTCSQWCMPMDHQLTPTITLLTIPCHVCRAVRTSCPCCLTCPRLSSPAVKMER